MRLELLHWGISIPPKRPKGDVRARVPSRATCCLSRLLILFERQRRYSEIGERSHGPAAGVRRNIGQVLPN